AAGRERNDQGDLSGRIGLRARRRASEDKRCNQQYCSDIGSALPLPLLSAEARLRAKADAGEGWGGGASASGFPVWREPPPAALCERVGLPRKRERRSKPADKPREHHTRLPYLLSPSAPAKMTYNRPARDRYFQPSGTSNGLPA